MDHVPHEFDLPRMDVRRRKRALRWFAAQLLEPHMPDRALLQLVAQSVSALLMGEIVIMDQNEALAAVEAKIDQELADIGAHVDSMAADIAELKAHAETNGDATLLALANRIEGKVGSLSAHVTAVDSPASPETPATTGVSNPATGTVSTEPVTETGTSAIGTDVTGSMTGVDVPTGDLSADLANPGTIDTTRE